MTKLILRNTTPDENRRLPRDHHTYVAFDHETRDEIAIIQWKYRPKNAGGPAYQALVKDRHYDNRVSVWSKELPKLCEIVRYVHTREGDPPSHWR